LLEALQKGCPINIQTRIVKCGRLNNPNNWDVIDHWSGGEVTAYNPGDAPNAEFSGESVSIEGSVSFIHYIRLVATALAELTTVEIENLLDIAGIQDEDCNACGNGYPGADKILFVGAASDGAATEANLLYTSNGGGTWAATSATPWSAGDFEDINHVEARFINQTQIRIVVGTLTTVAGNKANIRYADVTVGDEGTTVWSTTTIAATSLADVIHAMNWLLYDRLYIAAGTAGTSNIYVSDDQGTSDPGVAIYTGSVVINGFAISADESQVFAFGETNLLLRETNQSDVFETRVGPSGGGEFHSVTLAGDNTLYAGNGTSIYKSTDLGGNAGNWESLKDFGANQRVVAIQCIGGSRALGGDSQLLRAIVDDTTGASGTVWISVDGGATWLQITELTNDGYNAAYFSVIDDNKAVIVGDADATPLGTIHLLSPKA